jgi:DHA1 family multidrug resistance protein-like MFS transporter
MFTGMGIQWAATLLGCIAAVLVPVPIWFYLRGAKIRESSAFAPTMPKATVEREEEAKSQ